MGNTDFWFFLYHYLVTAFSLVSALPLLQNRNRAQMSNAIAVRPPAPCSSLVERGLLAGGTGSTQRNGVHITYIQGAKTADNNLLGPKTTSSHTAGPVRFTWSRSVLTRIFVSPKSDDFYIGA